MAYAVRILRNKDVDLSKSFSFNDLKQLYSELSEKEKSFLLKRFPINRLYENDSALLYRTCLYCSYWLDKSRVLQRCSNCSGNESRNSQCIQNHDKPIPSEASNEIKLVIERNVFRKLIILESKLSKPAAAVIVGEFKDTWYPIVAFGDEDYLNKFEQAIADSEEPKYDLPKHYYFWVSATAVTLLAGIIFLYGCLAWVNKWWPFENQKEVAVDQSAYSEIANTALPETNDLPLNWEFLETYRGKDQNEKKVITLKEKFSNLVSARMRRIGPYNDFCIVSIICVCEDGSVYESRPIYHSGIIMGIPTHLWKKLPTY